MTIKVLDMFPVVHHEGETMKVSETVTWFNDLCLMAPGALLRANITWEEIDKNHVRGTLTRDGIEVSATLTIDDAGRLTNFVSEDRYAVNDDGTYDNIPWSTPMTRFENIRGLNLSVEGDGVWHYPEKEHKYIHLNIQDVMINP